MNEGEQNEKFIKITTEPVEKLICGFAVPAIVSVLVTAIYNMADTIFISRISVEAVAAAGIIFAYMAFVQAIGYFFGAGSSMYVSRALGSKNKEGAEKMCATGFYTTIIVGVLVSILGLMFMEPLLYFLGATTTIIEPAKDYFFYILIGTPFIMTSFVLNNLMRQQGNITNGMIGIAIGAVLNIVLDPIFIFTLGLGVKGASMATAISQCIGFFALYYLSSKNGGIKISIKNFRPTMEQYQEIVEGGLPSLARQGLQSVATITLNRYAGFYGDSVIAGFSVVSRVMIFINSMILGFGQGFQPVCGFNYGAGLNDRVKKAVWFSVKVTSVYSVLVGIICFVFAEPIISLFNTTDPVMLGVGTTVLRWQSITYTTAGWVIVLSMFLQSIKFTKSASILAMGKQGIFFFPAIIILNTYFGLNGLMMTNFVAELCTFIMAIPMGIYGVKKLDSQNKALN